MGNCFSPFLSLCLPHFPSKVGKKPSVFGNGNSYRGVATLFFLISTQSTDAGVLHAGGSDVNAAGLLVSFTILKREKQKIRFYDGQLLLESFVSRGYFPTFKRLRFRIKYNRKKKKKEKNKHWPTKLIKLKLNFSMHKMFNIFYYLYTAPDLGGIPEHVPQALIVEGRRFLIFL